jgi:hypothetical protein
MPETFITPTWKCYKKNGNATKRNRTREGTSMTDEQINITIAEHCEWTNIIPYYCYYGHVRSNNEYKSKTP